MLNKWIRKAKAGLGSALTCYHQPAKLEPESKEHETHAWGSAPSPPPRPWARWSAEAGNLRPNPSQASRGPRCEDHPRQQTQQSLARLNKDRPNRRRSTSDVPAASQSRHPYGNHRRIICQAYNADSIPCRELQHYGASPSWIPLSHLPSPATPAPQMNRVHPPDTCCTNTSYEQLPRHSRTRLAAPSYVPKMPSVSDLMVVQPRPVIQAKRRCCSGSQNPRQHLRRVASAPSSFGLSADHDTSPHSEPSPARSASILCADQNALRSRRASAPHLQDCESVYKEAPSVGCNRNPVSCCDDNDSVLDVINRAVSLTAAWSSAANKGGNYEPRYNGKQDQTVANKLEQKLVNGADVEHTRRRQGPGTVRTSRCSQVESEQNNKYTELRAGLIPSDVKLLRTCEEVDREFARKLEQVPEVESEQLGSGLTSPLRGLNVAVKPTRIPSKRCVECGEKIKSSAVVWKERCYHSYCFVCNICNMPITDNEFRENNNAKKVYHDACYAKHFLPSCHICSQPIYEDNNGMVRYNQHPYFQDKYCMSHSLEGVIRCASCTRLQQNHTPYAQLADGRYLCLDCLDSAVLDNKDVQRIYSEVLQFLESTHNLKLAFKPALHLANQEAINKATQVEGEQDKSACGIIVACQGIVTAVEESDVLLSRQPTCSGSSILVIYGYPRLKTGSIIAYECMRAYLRFSIHIPLAPIVEEGLCRLVALLWLEEAEKRTSPRVFKAENLVSTSGYFAYELFSDTSMVSGVGLHAAVAAYQYFGALEHLLTYVRNTGWLPVVIPEAAGL